jgi:hypothetical protein
MLSLSTEVKIPSSLSTEEILLLSFLIEKIRLPHLSIGEIRLSIFSRAKIRLPSLSTAETRLSIRQTLLLSQFLSQCSQQDIPA